jgi:hypothetical protein
MQQKAGASAGLFGSRNFIHRAFRKQSAGTQPARNISYLLPLVARAMRKH